METPYQQFPQETVRSSKVFTASLTIIVLLLAGYALAAKLGGLWPFGEQPDTVACTQDAKLCPDGSYVGRTGPNCEFSACPTIAPDVLGDWKTHTNSRYGFEFKYPGDFMVKSVQTTGTVLGTTLTILPNDQENSLAPISLQISDLGARDKDRNAPATQTFIIGSDPSEIPIRLLIGDKIIYANCNYLGNRDFIPVCNKILSTFKFTDSTAGWKTYSYPQFGYSFALPTTHDVYVNTVPANNYGIVQSLSSRLVGVDSAPRDPGFLVLSATSLDDGIQKIVAGASPITNRKDVTIGGRVWTSFDFTSPLGGSEYVIYLNQKLYIIGATNNNELIELIASTFKFTK